MIWLAIIAIHGCKGDVETTQSATSATLPSTNRLARMTHLQYENTVQDLFGLDGPIGLAGTFIGDGLHEGFESNSEYLLIGPELWQDYQRAAESLGVLVVDDRDVYSRVVPQDPRGEDQGITFSDKAEAEGPSVDHSTGAVEGDAFNLWSDGELTWQIEIAEQGNYTVSTRVWADQDGPDLAQMALGIDGQDLVVVDVVAGSEGVAEIFEATADLAAGSHTVHVAFLNDYWVQGEADRNLLVDWIAIDGTIETAGASTAGPDETRAWIQQFGERAFRRPLTAPELDSYLQLFALAPTLLESGDDFADGVQVVVTAMLQSPFFLYRVEQSSDALPDGRIFLTDFEVASKLSYALWNTMPDAELFQAARDGALRSADDIRGQANRMLQDERASAMVDDFHRQLLGLDNYDNIYKDPDAFPTYSDQMNGWMKTEAAMYTQEMVFGGHGVHTLYTAPWTIANDELAAIYGAGPVFEPDENGFGRVDLDPSQRAGLLTQSGFLAVNADPNTESSIHRGVFINLALLCVDLPSPPDNIQPLPPPTGDLTNRERIEAHTGEGTCGAGCHSTMINPPGFAFEHYDALGQFRDTDHGLPVDSSGSLGADSWTDAIDFAAMLADNPSAHACYVQNWLEFLYGRLATPEDADSLQALSNRSRLEDRAILDLLVDLTVTETFRMRSSEVQ